MQTSWLRNTLPVAAIFSFRMLGLFMLIPVFTVYGNRLAGATPFLLGVALGAYGLSQGLLQIPFGILSDRYGRKPILFIGLVLFALGSILGGYTQSINGMILARILQGSGAVGSVLIALLGDLTLDEHRTKAMAIVGISIALSFSLALIISPLIASQNGLAGIFYVSTGLAIFGLLIVYFMIPTPKKLKFAQTVNTSHIKAIMTNPHLLRLDAGIFFQHLILTSTFFAIPMILRQQIQQGQLNNTWSFYLPIMILSFLIMMPCISLAEKKLKIKLMFTVSITLTALSQWLLAFSNHSFWTLCLFLFIYFVAFNILEASLPSQVSKHAHQPNRGLASGIYSSCQFLGIFAGGALSGTVFQWFAYPGIFIANGCIALIWLLIAYSMNPLQYELILSLPYPDSILPSGLQNQLSTLTGVREVVFDESEQIIYLRVDKSLYVSGSADKLLSGSAHCT